MWVKFSCRFTKTLTPAEIEAEQEEAEIQKLLGKEYIKKNVDYVYDPLIQNLDNIVAFNHYDDEHLSLRTKLGEVFIVKGTINRAEELLGDVLSFS